MESIDAVIHDTGEVIAIDRRGGLNLPGVVSRIGLLLPEELSLEEWTAIGQSLSGVEQSIMWWLGDWWVYGENRRWGAGEEVAAKLGVNYGTCRNAGAVSRNFDLSRRRDNLTWTHHADATSAASPEEADALLDWCEEPLARGEKRPRSTRELRAEISRRKAASFLGIPSDSDGTMCVSDDLHRLAARIAAGELPPFGTVYADPPWRYSNQGTRAATGNHYKGIEDEDGRELQSAAGMSMDEIRALPIDLLVAKDSHLHLWTTNGFLEEALGLIRHWGFEFRSTFVWNKRQMGIGNYWRNSHELMLTAIRGNAKRFRDKSLKSWIVTDRGRHSAKPGEVRQFIERASPGPYLELFARQQYENWAVWGNQIDRSLFDRSTEGSLKQNVSVPAE